MKTIQLTYLLFSVFFLSTSFGFAQRVVKADKKVPQEIKNRKGKESKSGTIVTEKLESLILRDNLVGLDPNRSIKVYLPPDYSESGKSYPVVYYCHNLQWSPEQVFSENGVPKLLERAFAQGIVQEFIFVAADYTSVQMGSLYENSPTSGRWLDYTVEEVVPFIDSRFRTIKHRDSRALTGDFMGGRGALKLAMEHSDLFGVVYALHPVATGIGQLPWSSIPVDWKKVHEAKTFDELAGQGRAQIFVAIAQAVLPNPDRPPFYCDFWVEYQNGELKQHLANTRKAQVGFHLDETLDERADNLRNMRGIAIDWARYDPTQAHVYSVEAFSKKLTDLGVEHEAEEYLGDPWNKNWIEHGRFYSRVLPFLARRLVFEVPN